MAENIFAVLLAWIQQRNKEFPAADEGFVPKFSYSNLQQPSADPCCWAAALNSSDEGDDTFNHFLYMEAGAAVKGAYTLMTL